MTMLGRLHMPSLGGATGWLNSEPLSPAELRGHVVAVNLWTLTCINWLRQERHHRRPALRRGSLCAIRAGHPAAARHPARARLGPRGRRGGRSRPGPPADARDLARRRTRPPVRLTGRRHLRRRSRRPAPEHLHLNHWALAGEWTIGRERVLLDQAGGTIAYRFRARDAHLVLSSGARAPIPFRVLLDGQAPGPSHGLDVDPDGNGVLTDGACTSWGARTTRSATGPWRSPS